MNITILLELLILFALSVISLFICIKFKMSELIGFFVVGIAAGPHGLALIKGVHDVEMLAEIGVILLLFTIGIEFSLKSLFQMSKIVFVGGALQVGLMVLPAIFVGRLAGFGASTSFFIGILLALSSTTIAMRLLQERGELHSPHGRIILGISIFQDIMIIPVMLILPYLSGGDIPLFTAASSVFLKACLIFLFTWAGIKYIVPHLLEKTVRTQSRELFLLTVLLICGGIVWFSSLLGLSLALGAFLAGLIISETEYSHRAVGSILPFRDIFSSFFFISVGMLLDLGFILANPGVILLALIGILAFKFLACEIAVWALRYPIRTVVMAGVGLAQIGEFSFILMQAGTDFKLISVEYYQFLLATAVISMALTPFAFAAAAKFSARLKGAVVSPRETAGRIEDHLIIVGFGVIGRTVAKSAREAGIAYSIIELNPDTIKKARADGEAIMYGDAVQENVLLHANIESARIIVISIPDPAAVQRITAEARRINPNVYIIARTRLVHEMETLYKIGANEVIPEEFETAIEIFARVLVRYLVPHETIKQLIYEVREGGYELFRDSRKHMSSMANLKSALPDVDIVVKRVSSDSDVAGKSIGGLEFRRRFNATILAVRREGRTISNPAPDEIVKENDFLLIMGKPQDLMNIL